MNISWSKPKQYGANGSSDLLCWRNEIEQLKENNWNWRFTGSPQSAELEKSIMPSLDLLGVTTATLKPLISLDTSRDLAAQILGLLVSVASAK